MSDDIGDPGPDAMTVAADSSAPATTDRHATSPAAPASTGLAALRDMRRTRQRRRLGEIEWFDAAYRVYLVALGGGIAMVWLSDMVGDGELSAARALDVADHGPAVLGMVAVLALAAGLRSGSQGGPLALEAADVTFVMLAPVDRRRALSRPAVQRIRSAVFLAMVVGAVGGQLAGRRLPGTTTAWFLGGALFGAVVGLLWVGGALVAHVIRLPLAIATLVSLVLVAWQALAIWSDAPGVADTVGSLGLWGWQQHAVDLAGLGVGVLLAIVGLALVDRTSLDALARRSSLVAQLRFAVTMQDLRTVVLLRRQLGHERTRSRPWFQLAHVGRAHPVWRRGWQSLLRFPAGRLIRMTALAIGAGACQVAAFRGTTPAILGTMACTFVLGLEVLEPLSQEVDQPDRTESLPVERGDLMARHLFAPAVALVPFAIVGAAAAVVVEVLEHDDASGALAVAAILALPTVIGGAAGATVNIVRDAPDPLAASNQQSFMPPEMAGFHTALRTLIPLVVSALCAASVLLVRAAVRDQGPGAAVGGAVRGAAAVALVAGGVVLWVRSRDRVRRRIRAFLAEGRAHTRQQRTT